MWIASSHAPVSMLRYESHRVQPCHNEQPRSQRQSSQRKRTASANYLRSQNHLTNDERVLLLPPCIETPSTCTRQAQSSPCRPHLSPYSSAGSHNPCLLLHISEPTRPY